MMLFEIKYKIGETPLDDYERDGLLIKNVTSRRELDEFENLNIQQAIEWASSKNFSKDKILSFKFINLLHRKMFCSVWRWAGEFRESKKNLGVDKSQIRNRLKILLDDASYWIRHSTYPPEEIAIRVKHRIVQIHCFPNGNGRHSRLLADLIIKKVFKLNYFTWGAGDLVHDLELRSKYLTALRKSDEGEYTSLIEFALS